MEVRTEASVAGSLEWWLAADRRASAAPKVDMLPWVKRRAAAMMSEAKASIPLRS